MGLTRLLGPEGSAASVRTSPWLRARLGAAQRFIRRDTRDMAAAAFVVVLDTVLFTQLTEAESRGGWIGRDVPALVIVLAALAALPPLALRRRWPLVACLLVAAHAALVTLAIGSRPLAGPLLALFTAAAWESAGRAALAVAAVLSAHSMAVAYEAATVAGTAFAVAAVASVFLLLDLSAYAFGRRSSSGRERTRMLEESRAALAAEAVAKERLRIARELHDIVAHAVTIMVLQAAGAGRVVDRDPAQAAASMRSVQETGTQAIAELRRLLTVLRSVDDARDEEPGEAPCLAGIAKLASQVEATGVRVTVDVAGPVGELDPSVELAAYRIVQESLTNASRHAGPGSDVEVRLAWSPETLAIDVTDNGTGVRASEVPAMSIGYGFAGLAERIKLVGGQFAAGPRSPAGGYHVRAVLPSRALTTLSVASPPEGTGPE